MLTCFVFLLALIYIVRKGEGVQINYVRVPQAVRNNSGRPIVLDCNYSVRADDTELVVKWFLNGEMVYQWLPPQKPQSLGLLKERLELDFEASGDPNAVHRAMKVVNPTTDVAGEYKCVVSTFTDEDFSIKTMIVFEPESDLELYRGKPVQGRLNFTCIAADVYPQPKLVLYKDKKDDLNLEAIEWKTRKLVSGKYTVILTSNILLSELDRGSLIFCELRIPGTGYVKKRSILYYPEADVENWNGSDVCGPSRVWPNYVLYFCLHFVLYM